MPPRILVATTSYPAHDQDFVGVFVWRLNRALEAFGAEVQTLALWREAESFPGSQPFKAVEWVGRAAGFGRRSLEAEVRDPRRWRAVMCGLNELQQRVQQRAADSDLLLCHWGLLYAPWSGWKLPSSVRMCVVIHGGELDALRRIPGLLRRRLATLPPGSLLWCVRFQDRERCAKFWPRELILTGPIGLLDDRPAPSQPESKEWGPILCVGRLVRAKGFDRALCAADPGSSVWIVGAGPEAARLARLAHQKSLDFRLLGALPPSEIAVIMSQCGVLVAPSRRGLFGRSEGFPTVVLEAIAAGLPVVLTAAGGALAWRDLPGLYWVRPEATPDEIRRAIRAAREGPRPDQRVVPWASETAAQILAAFG